MNEKQEKVKLKKYCNCCQKEFDEDAKEYTYIDSVCPECFKEKEKYYDIIDKLYIAEVEYVKLDVDNAHDKIVDEFDKTVSNVCNNLKDCKVKYVDIFEPLLSVEIAPTKESLKNSISVCNEICKCYKIHEKERKVDGRGR